MKREEIESNLKKIIGFYKNEMHSLMGLKSEISSDDENTVLATFLKSIGLENTKENRFSAFERLVTLKEDTLEMNIEKT